MSVLDQLAGALGRRDEKPNEELAAAIAARRDIAAINKLVEALGSSPRGVQSNAIKVLYEVGARNPGLITPHLESFCQVLTSSNNRLVWGAMTALDYLTASEPKALLRRLPEILRAAEKASVIAKDRAVSILCNLSTAGYSEKAAPALLKMLQVAAVNQLPMYAEMAARALPSTYIEALRRVLVGRLVEVAQESKRRRLGKVLRGLRA